MAITIDADDYKKVRSDLYRGTIKTELKNLTNLPDKSELQAAIQFCMSTLDNNKATIKSGIDSALGITTTASLAAAIFEYSTKRYLERYN